MDTTRADALSCYGRIPRPAVAEVVTTPVIDQIAAEGTRFERFYTTAPSTLSSHATMLSGVDQHVHGVVRNGFPLASEVPTLPERLHREGWDTIAVVGAAALESAMGLDRGFRVYDDDMRTLRGMMYQDDAAGVVDRSLSAVDARPASAPLFLLVHFYDPHTPYVPPERHRQRFTDPKYRGSAVGAGDRFKVLAQQARARTIDGADVQHINELYLAEVAYMDEQIGRLLAGLEERGVLEHALVVLLADHGETLVDDPTYAWSHGSSVGHEVMWVPLIMKGYGLPLAGRSVVRRQVSMTGLASTIERSIGLTTTFGADFHAMVRPGPALDVDGWPDRPTEPVFMEATRPRHAEAPLEWNNLRLHRAVWAGGWGAWASPWRRMPLAFDPHGRVGHPGVMGILGRMLADWDADLPPHREAAMAPATEEALRALGYIE